MHAACVEPIPACEEVPLRARVTRLPPKPGEAERGWLAALDDFRNWLIREAA
jgi:hypothetical protein